MSATISKQNATLIAGLTFAAGVFVGSLLSTELIQVQAPTAQQGAGAPQAAAQQPAPKDMARLRALEAKTLEAPDDPGVWTALGNAYFDASMPAKAVDAYQRSLKLAPGNPNVLTDMGVMFRRMGQHQNALAAFGAAIKADPSHQVARLNSGIVLLHDLGDQQGAAEAWEGLLAINPQAMAPGGVPVRQMVEQLKGLQRQEKVKRPAAPEMILPNTE